MNVELKSNLENYSKILAGKIILDNIQIINPEDISGYIKLKNVPKSEQFNFKNIILFQSKLTHADWIMGVALFTKRDCFVLRKYQRNLVKTNHLKNYLSEKIAFFLISTLFLSLVIIKR